MIPTVTRAAREQRDRCIGAGDLPAIARRQRWIDQEDVLNPVVAGGPDNLLFAAEDCAVGADRHEMGVGAVGHVLDQTGRQRQQRAVVVDGVVETASPQQEGTGEDQVADAAVVEIERPSGAGQFGRECLDALGQRRLRRGTGSQHRQRVVGGQAVTAGVRRADLTSDAGDSAQFERQARGVLAEVGRSKRSRRGTGGPPP